LYVSEGGGRRKNSNMFHGEILDFLEGHGTGLGTGVRRLQLNTLGMRLSGNGGVNRVGAAVILLVGGVVNMGETLSCFPQIFRDHRRFSGLQKSLTVT
jgi:hypothetical protein